MLHNLYRPKAFEQGEINRARLTLLLHDDDASEKLARKIIEIAERGGALAPQELCDRALAELGAVTSDGEAARILRGRN